MTNKKDSSAVIMAILATIKYFRDYWEGTCRQRLADGIGSVFEGITSVGEMTDALSRARWEEATHPNVMPGCKAYKTTDIKGGRYGLVKIETLEDDAGLITFDPKDTGFVELTVAGVKGDPAEETWLITGEEEGHTIVFTFHPGEPICPSRLEASKCPPDIVLTKDEALDLGFVYAKVA